jgi:hypothetical protein
LQAGGSSLRELVRSFQDSFLFAMIANIFIHDSIVNNQWGKINNGVKVNADTRTGARTPFADELGICSS